MKKQVGTLGFSLGLIAVFLLVGGAFGTGRAPPVYLVDDGVCPGEGCSYGKWKVRKPTPIRSKPANNAPIVGTAETGAIVEALTGQAHSIPGRFLVKRSHGRYKKGDVLWVYSYAGEGMFKVWFDGALYDEDLLFSPYGGSTGARCEASPECWGELKKEFESTWWVRIRTAEGITGWTADTGHLTGKSVHDNPPPMTGVASSAPTPPLPEYVQDQHKELLRDWLSRNPKFRIAIDRDCCASNQTYRNDRETHKGSASNPYFYYASEDLNHDGIGDFAVVLIDRTREPGSAPPVARKTPNGSINDRWRKWTWTAALAVFSGPFKGAAQPAYFREEVGVPSSSILWLNDSTLKIGPSESDKSLLKPTASGYVLSGDTITVDGKTVTLWPAPKRETQEFHFDSKGYRNSYAIDCESKRFQWFQNMRLSDRRITENSAGAKWKSLNPKSKISNAVYAKLCTEPMLEGVALPEITSDVVWQGDPSDIYHECKLGDRQCVMHVMRSTGASEQALALFRRSGGRVIHFQELGAVDVITVELIFSANPVVSRYLVNGTPELISMGYRLTETDRNREDVRQALVNDPGAFLFSEEFARKEPLSDGTRYVERAHFVRCMACRNEVIARAEIAYDLDANGVFRGSSFLRVLPPDPPTAEVPAATESQLGAFRLEMRDGSVLVGQIETEMLGFRSSLGAVEVNADEILRFSGDLLSLDDGTVFKGRFDDGVLEFAAKYGSVNIRLADVASIGRVSTE